MLGGSDDWRGITSHSFSLPFFFFFPWGRYQFPFFLTYHDPFSFSHFLLPPFGSNLTPFFHRCLPFFSTQTRTKKTNNNNRRILFICPDDIWVPRSLFWGRRLTCFCRLFLGLFFLSPSVATATLASQFLPHTIRENGSGERGEGKRKKRPFGSWIALMDHPSLSPTVRPSVLPTEKEGYVCSNVCLSLDATTSTARKGARERPLSSVAKGDASH